MKKDLKVRTILYPEPVLVIGTYDLNNNPNAMVAAWGGLSSDNEVCICLSFSHKTAKNLLKTKAFTVSFATKKYVKEIDYLGNVSFYKDKDKLKKVGFTVSKAKKVKAPIINELPLTFECKLIKYDKKTCHTFGKIVNIKADQSILNKGKIDIKKLKPIIYDGDNHGYFEIGKKVGQAYSEYKKIK